MSGKLEGKVAIITGSSRGIGKAIAQEFANEGAKVCINYVKSDKAAEQVIKEIRSSGGDAITVKADVSKITDVKKLIHETIENFGTIDILVNNAAIFREGDFIKTKDEELYSALDEMWRTNVMGAIYCCKEAIKYMIKKRSGKIINIASIAGIGTALSGTTAYAITKSAIILLTKRLAFELGPYGITVNAIAPGMILTDMSMVNPSRIEVAKRRSILNKVGNPKDVAKLALFLASEDSNYITGQIIVADGGRIDYLTHSL